MQGIAFTQSLCDGSKQIGELIIAVYIGRILLYWVLHSQDGRIFSSLGIEHTDTVRVFYGKVDVLKDFLPLATSAKGMAMPMQIATKNKITYSTILVYSSVSSMDE